jgi:hypothetical protein
MLETIFLQVTDKSQVYFLLICSFKNDVFDKQGIRIDVDRYNRSFLKFVGKVPTNSATKFVA